jgi:hypothetical protein
LVRFAMALTLLPGEARHMGRLPQNAAVACWGRQVLWEPVYFGSDQVV